MAALQDHPMRFQLPNELHARPFPTLEAPCRAAYLAFKPATNAAARERDEDRAHLIELLDRYGAPHPQPGATHWFGAIGNHMLKWESHTEFVTYTLFGRGVAEVPFDAATFAMFPDDWLANAPGVRVTSILLRVEQANLADTTGVDAKLESWFVPESLAVARVLDDAAVVAGDFRIDPAGHMRFAVFTNPETGPRRLGRIVQRLTEIETYKSMSMLGFARARETSAELGTLDARLGQAMEAMTRTSDAAETLDELLSISSSLETLRARAAFRFAATGAYEAIVNQRIAILREERFGGRQTFAEFMMRRFDPAMRTVKATDTRLQATAERAIRAGDLLRTRVDVDRSAQNQKLLESMDRRADLQLRLQRTVEGLSVVAISYYAVNLVLYLLTPVAAPLGVEKLLLGAIVTPVVIGGVWWMVRRIRKHWD